MTVQTPVRQRGAASTTTPMPPAPRAGGASRPQPNRDPAPKRSAAAGDPPVPAPNRVPTPRNLPAPGRDIYDAITEACARMAHQDDATVADHAMSLVGLPPRYRPAIAPIVVNGVTDERRRRTRALERDAATGPRTAPDGRAVRVIAGGAEPDVERLRLLLDAEFAVGHGQRVTNRDATVEQHRAYIDMLSRQEAGLASTRALHEQMVSVIEEAGAKTLGEALGGGAR